MTYAVFPLYLLQSRTPIFMNRSSTATDRPLFRFAAIDIISYLIVVAVFVGIILSNSRTLGYRWQWYQVPKYLFSFGDEGFSLGRLIQGLKVTLLISGLSLILTVVLGVLTALFRLSNSLVARAVARVYLEGIRNTPLLIQLFFLYFVISPIIGISPFWTAVLALSAFEGAYASEIIRGALLGIPKGQWEAARALGLGPAQMYLKVLIPQAWRIALPPLISQGVSLIKDSALVSTIAIFDLTMEGQAIVSETFLTFEIWFTVAAIYLIITVILSRLIHLMDKP